MGIWEEAVLCAFSWPLWLMGWKEGATVVYEVTGWSSEPLDFCCLSCTERFWTWI